MGLEIVDHGAMEQELRQLHIDTGEQDGPFIRLFHYLSHIGCHTMCREEPVVDEEYFREFLTYFGTTFIEHDPCAKRLHFFRCGPNDVTAYLDPGRQFDDKETERLDYLGYCVVRPTSPPRLGETLIRVPEANGGRYYNHCATMFGQTIRGKRFRVAAAPFIAQNETGVCAQAALWGALKYLHKYRYYPKVSLPEITWLGGQLMAETTAIRPATGMSSAGIHAILRRLGFQLHVADMEQARLDRDDCREEIYTGLESGLPVILLLSTGSGHAGSGFPQHAVWVTGHTLKATVPPPEESPDTMYRFGEGEDSEVVDCYSARDRVEHFLVHDDQRGPYLRALVDADELVTYYGYGTEPRPVAAPTTNVSEVVIPLPEEVFVAPPNARRIAAYCLFGKHMQQILDLFREREALQAGAVPEAALTLAQQLRTSVSRFLVRTFLCMSVRYQEYAVRSRSMCGDLKQLIAADLRLPEYIWVTEVQLRDQCVGEGKEPCVVASLIVDSTDASPFMSRRAARYLLLHLPGFARWRVGIHVDDETSQANVRSLPSEEPRKARRVLADEPINYDTAILEEDGAHDAYSLNAEGEDPPRSHRALGPVNMPHRWPQ